MLNRTTTGPNRNPMLAHIGSLACISACWELIYLVAYKRTARPQEWSTWFDQSRYFRSAHAWAVGNLTASNHYYPAGYPLLGAAFVRAFPSDPFFLVDLASFVVVAVGFTQIARRYVPFTVAAILFVASSVMNYALFREYIIPWTTSPIAALIVVLIAFLQRGIHLRRDYFLFGLLAGAIILIRPIDIVVTLPMYATLLLRWFNGGRGHAILSRLRERAGELVALTTGSLIGPLAYCLLNLRIYGTVLGSYVAEAGQAGFSLSLVPQHFVTIFVDSASLYGDPHDALLHTYPLMFLSFVGMTLAIFRGPELLRCVALSIALQFVCYLSYGGMLPTGLWRFNNIHYFKWAFPFLALFAVMAVVDVYRHPRRAGVGLVAALLLVMTSITLAWQRVPAAIAFETQPDGSLRTVLTFDGPHSVQAVDFYTVTGSYTDVYFTHPFVEVNGEPPSLPWIAGVHLVPMPWGARVLLTHSVNARSLVVGLPRTLLHHADERSVVAGRYHFSLTLPPRWFWRFNVGPRLYPMQTIGEPRQSLCVPEPGRVRPIRAPLPAGPPRAPARATALRSC